MALSALSRRTKLFGPESNGILMTPEEFDGADFDECWRYELINGLLIVMPLSLINEADANEELGSLLRNYGDRHPQGFNLDATLPERLVHTSGNLRRADRVLWAGLGRNPRRGEAPTVIIEFVSDQKQYRKRDYETKRDDYLAIGVKEYWVFDRFYRTLTVFVRSRGKVRTRVFAEDKVYQTPLLPGFEVPLRHLFAKANAWGEDQPG